MSVLQRRGVHSGGTKRATSVDIATSAPTELGGESHKVPRNRARTQVPPQAQKLHVYGSGTFGAFWIMMAVHYSIV